MCFAEILVDKYKVWYTQLDTSSVMQEQHSTLNVHHVACQVKRNPTYDVKKPDKGEAASLHLYQAHLT